LDCLASTIDSVRARRKFLCAGYALMPDHWHAILLPGPADDLPRIMNALKVATMRHINARRGEHIPLWQPRYYDEILRTVKQFQETLRYMHFNPVEKGLVGKPEDWRWSSFHCFGGSGDSPLRVDNLNLPADETTRL
jgi:REP element-mobilizing transposase RayT